MHLPNHYLLPFFLLTTTTLSAQLAPRAAPLALDRITLSYKGQTLSPAVYEVELYHPSQEAAQFEVLGSLLYGFATGAYRQEGDTLYLPLEGANPLLLVYYLGEVRAFRYSLADRLDVWKKGQRLRATEAADLYQRLPEKYARIVRSEGVRQLEWADLQSVNDSRFKPDIEGKTYLKIQQSPPFAPFPEMQPQRSLPGWEQSNYLSLRFYNAQRELLPEVEVDVLAGQSKFALGRGRLIADSDYPYLQFDRPEALQGIPCPYGFRLVVRHPDYGVDTLPLYSTMSNYFLFRPSEAQIAFQGGLPFQHPPQPYFVLTQSRNTAALKALQQEYGFSLSPYQGPEGMPGVNRFYLSFEQVVPSRKAEALRELALKDIKYGRAFVLCNTRYAFHPVALKPALNLFFYEKEAPPQYDSIRTQLAAITLPDYARDEASMLLNGRKISRSFLPADIYKLLNEVGLAEQRAQILQRRRGVISLQVQYPEHWDLEKIRAVVQQLHATGRFISINPVYYFLVDI